jgi:hypothetical protein
MALAILPMAVTYSAGMVAAAIGCDLNEVAAQPCSVLGMNVGPLLATMAQSIWLVAFTLAAGLLALIVLFIVWIARVVKARRAKVD